MSYFRNTQRLVLASFLVSVVLTFFYIRPLKSPWHPFIAGDGLGYYSYLPAKFIYHDTQLNYAWFNKAYNANYVYSSFQNPEDNLLVAYNGKRINKYYQGLSFIWMPFFLAAHVFAKLFHYPSDGFSLPYQWAMGLASLVYLLIGLLYLKKLLVLLFKSETWATLCTASIFFGTHLFTYAISANTLSHAYSFTFMVLFLYYSLRFFEASPYSLRYFLLSLLFLVLTVCIRPLNGLILLILPAFIPVGFFKQKLRFEKITLQHILILILLFAAIFYQVSTTYTQTGSFLAYTYTDEKFDFVHNRFFDGLFSYYMGLFVYVPLALLAMFGIAFLPTRQRIMLPLFFFALVFLYSSWWYWLITKRALIDYYPLVAIMLAALLSNCKSLLSKYLAVGSLCICVVYYQFKEMQVHKGILDEFATYKEVFWRNFFRTDKASMYLIPPESILKQEVVLEDFEDWKEKNNLDSVSPYSGNYCLKLDQKNYIQTLIETPFPSIFNATMQRCKIRFSFHMNAQPDIKKVHAFIQFFDTAHKSLLDAPLYLNKEDIFPGKWDFKEFGYDVADTTAINASKVRRIGFTIWNVEAKNVLKIDALKAEYILTDKSFETTK